MVYKTHKIKRKGDDFDWLQDNGSLWNYKQKEEEKGKKKKE